MAMKDRMHTGALYLPGDDEIMDRQQLCLDRLYEFNHTRPFRNRQTPGADERDVCRTGRELLY